MSDLYSVTINNEDIILEVSETDFGTVVIGGTQKVEIVVEGGVPGPPGAPGTSGAGFNYIQTLPSSTWIINHNLGFRPSIDLFTVGGMEMLGEVVHTSINQTVVNFTEALAGFARLT